MRPLAPAEVLSHVLHSSMRRMFRRLPKLRSLALTLLAPIYRVALFPFRRAQGRGVAAEHPEVSSRTVEYNEAAEQYFASYPNPEYLLAKPFGDPFYFAKHLIDLGTLVSAARLRPGDTVAEIGAGSCWVSHFLNRFGCRTVAIDVSPTALDLGRQLFQSDPRTHWSLDPTFVSYDGRTIPLADGACDRVIICDAFHHIPNQRELLKEMLRILTPEGVVAMSEPGVGHGSVGPSLTESASTGVLENELVLEDVAALAEDVGFRTARVITTGSMVHQDVPARELGRFMGGKGFGTYWKALCASLNQHHYILLHKGPPQPTTARPGQLAYQLDLLAPHGEVTLSPRDRLPVRVRLTNMGDTRWLHRGLGESGDGWTRLGVHLYETGPPLKPIDLQWYRASFDADVEPGASVTLSLDLPATSGPSGRSLLLVFDLVVEKLAWVSDFGSQPGTLTVTVL